jgi:thiamine biosynthesis protein ThiI
MNENVILATYSEVALKSPPVRRRLENQLMIHIRNVLKMNGVVGADVNKISGRLLVENIDPLKNAKVLSNVFGIASAMPAIRTTNDLDTIIRVAVEIASHVIPPNKTFAVRSRRIGLQKYTSKDIEVHVGEAILKNLSKKGVRVNLETPDKIIYVEAREKNAYIYYQIFRGPEGLPFGSQGKLISLFSGGIDSPVATWLMMKRGAHSLLLFLDQRPFVGNDYCQRAKNVAKEIRNHVPIEKYELNIGFMSDIMKEITDKVPPKLSCVICKRMMYRIACKFAERKRADGIITGEVLGQVASQTLANLRILDDASSLPVYRPLVGFEKNECVEFAKRIGTYELSIVKVHGCNVVPFKPTTKARIDTVKNVEKLLDIRGLISESLNNLTTLPL